MVVEQDASCLMSYGVRDQRRSLATVLIMAGAHTTVLTTKTCQSHAPRPPLHRHIAVVSLQPDCHRQNNVRLCPVATA